MCGQPIYVLVLRHFYWRVFINKELLFWLKLQSIANIPFSNNIKVPVINGLCCHGKAKAQGCLLTLYHYTVHKSMKCTFRTIQSNSKIIWQQYHHDNNTMIMHAINIIMTTLNIHYTKHIHYMYTNVGQTFNYVATKHAALLYATSIMQLLASSLHDQYWKLIQFYFYTCIMQFCNIFLSFIQILSNLYKLLCLLTCAWLHACMYVYSHLCLYIHNWKLHTYNVCMYVCTYVGMYVYMPVCMYVCMYVHM